ncbi:MAG: hypothetical protein HUK40_18160 [Desulfobacter sp.]|nr:hypothetical protein [Desulfobacter sp.]WDP85868.1 MAG: hypothetical protein HUN05_12590 [Desulfobacter sp.]
MAEYHDKKLSSDLNYYYCGRSSIPDAVVGIDKSYTFEDKFWFKIESREDLYDKIRNLSDLEPEHSMMYAKDILDPQGRSIGTWFSFYNTTGIKVDEHAGVIEVFSPYKPSSRFSPG